VKFGVPRHNRSSGRLLHKKYGGFQSDRSPSPKTLPTWWKLMHWRHCIAKRLDHFLLSKYLLHENFCFRQWVSSGGISYHSPILFELAPDPIKPPNPFKFNSSWLEDPNYLDLVRTNWTPLNENLPESPPLQFLENLKKIKKAIIAWRKEQRNQRKSRPPRN
jgi:hypothetical protein